ncbi:DNA repair protein complementing XP-A cells homolog [Fopius arisanus]|uniref:DNA repair protein complementing XP-A cells homolog n=1 Tax=Fopius arisanus TaxID=64838 RepID=A0A9R1TXC4_9HYME|nr:PREDICTED: DNA repair protein complementing XP-A cells homolog [Fopius arisanus]
MSEKKNEESAERGSESPQWYKERAERNRQKALLLKKSKLVVHPYAKNSDDVTGSQGRQLKVQGKKVVDSGGGFLIEEDDELEEQMLEWTEDPFPIFVDLPTCEECQKQFQESYLLKTFDYNVCDACRDREEKHTLITKTEAKDTYLLRDYDLDQREPPLKFILKANPHRAAYGHMKLYLHLQIEKRALEVWGSEEALVEEKEKREIKRQETKIKRFNKKVKQLRMEVRSSMYDKTKKATHVHVFGPDTYNEEDDTYSHACTECEYEETFEKM